MRLLRTLFAWLLWCRVCAVTAFLVTTTASSSLSLRRHSTSLRAAAATTTTTSITKQKCDICILGGGFGGLYTALQIAAKERSRSRQNRQNRRLDIVLVDPSDRFVFLPLLYDLVEGTATRQEVCPTYRELLQGTNIRLIQGQLQNITTNTSSTRSSPGSSSGDGTAVVQDAVNSNNVYHLQFAQGVVAVGATPQQMLATVPGSDVLVQPFYTAQHAMETRDLLARLDRQVLGHPHNKQPLQIAVVGGGYGGVELAACLQRRFGNTATARVTLLARSPPLQGTRAEPVVRQALDKLGVTVELGVVKAIEAVVEEHDNDKSTSVLAPVPRVRVLRQTIVDDDHQDTTTEPVIIGQDQAWDAVFWTAGSGPAEPVSNPQALCDLERIQGRLATDRTLRCNYKPGVAVDKTQTSRRRQPPPQPPLWALGDCATVIGGVPTPKTAQAAMQQADVVAYNVLLEHYGTAPVAGANRRRMPTTTTRARTFTYQDLGSLMNLGGTNGVIAAPPDSTALGPVFAPLLDTARFGLGVADTVLKELAASSSKEKSSSSSSSSSVLANLSLGGHGLGVQEDDPSRGSLTGTLAGAARRAVYAARMPTNRQRVYSAASAALSTALTLAKEASEDSRRQPQDK